MGVKFTGKDLDLLNSSINDLFSDDFLDTVDGSSSPETMTNDESSIMDELNDIANGKQPVTLQPIDDDDEVIIVPSDESDTELVESHNEQTSIEEEIDEMLNPKTDAPKQKTANKSKKKPTVKETADERQEEETHIEPVLYEEEQEEQIQEVQQYDELTDRLEGLTIPQWAEGLYSKLKASVAHSFMLSGNVRDYFTGHISIEDGLALLVSRRLRFAVFAEYDQAHGLTFDLAKRTYGDDPMAVKQRFISMLDAARANLHMPPSEGTIPQDVTELFTCLAEIYEMPPIDGYDANICLIVDYADLLIPDSRGQQMRDADKRLQIVIADLCRSTKADEGCSCLVMLTDNPDGVSSYIRDTASRTDQIAIPHPTLETRREFINGVLDRDDYTLDDGRQIFSCEDGVSCEYLAVNTAGLACYQIEDIVLRALADNTPITPQVVKDRKNEIIKNDYNDVIEIMDPRGGFETIGGLDRVKRFFTEEVIEPIHEQKLEAVPMGVLLMGPPGSAKAIADSTPIPTPLGMRTVGEIKEGDYIFGDDGKPTRVLVVAPQGEREAYELMTRDGRSIVCSSDHIWRVGYKSHGRIKWEDMTVQKMLDRGIYSLNKDGSRSNRSKFFLPTSACCEYPEQKLPLPPYVLGAFLGDGCRKQNGTLVLSGTDEKIISEVACQLGCRYLHEGAGTDRGTSANHNWIFYHELPIENIKGKRVHATDLCKEAYEWVTVPYAHEKKIPSMYKISSREQRLELLRGLMDTDGSITRNNGRYNIRFSTTSKQLAQDVAEVVHSLGWCASITFHGRKGELSPNKNYPDRSYHRKHDMWEVSLLIPKEERYLVFKLSRKREIALEARDVRSSRNYSRIAIASITPLHRKEKMTCFYVDNKSHLFLAGNYVPTHNTALSRAVAYEAGMNCVELNMNHIMDKYVGQSERNLDRALDCAMAMQPTIIFIDEIDEALPKRHMGEISSVNSRINKRLLQFFSETKHRGQVMILAATNFPDKIDAAFKRAGRFDKRIPMFAPDDFDRIRIIRIMAARAATVNGTFGDSRPYSVSCLADPDTMVSNPFRELRRWMDDGNVPMTSRFFGEKVEYHAVHQDKYGQTVEEITYLPNLLLDIVDKRRIPLWQLYRGCDILLGDRMPVRKDDTASMSVEDDKTFYRRITDAIYASQDIFGTNPKNLDRVSQWLQYRDKYYAPFASQTFRMTGAELEVVMSKAITLFRRWQKNNPEAYAKMVAQGHERDIPWSVLLEASTKMTASMASVKAMEDAALKDTSDTDHIPDALYGRTKDGADISYRQRYEELRLMDERVD